MNYHEFLAAMAAWHRLFDVFLPHFLEKPGRHKVASRISLHDHLLKACWCYLSM